VFYLVMATSSSRILLSSPISYICLVCGQSHPWCGTFDSACLQHRIFHVKCRSCNMNFALVIIATDHFNTHTAITMLSYQSVPVTGLTINPPTYMPTMVMSDRSPPPSPAVLLHMISNHLTWLANEVANMPVPSYGTRRSVTTGRLRVADLAFRRQLATWYPELVPDAPLMSVSSLARAMLPHYTRRLFQVRMHLSQ